MLALPILLFAHVPTYSGSACVKPPHSHDVSQVVYLKNSGGLEIHIESDTEPFDTLGGEIIDVDVTFKGEPDPSTYELYIGCGGCGDGDALVEASRLATIQYETPHVEPFTQTAYTSIFAKDDKKFNTSALQNASCPQKHFAIRLERFDNASEIVWGAVVGIKESFTFVELLEFPIYILRNHSDSWNGLWYTMLIACFVAAPLSILVGKYAVAQRRVKPLEGLTVERKIYLREIFYEVAIFAFAVSMWEEFIHLCYAQSGIAIGWGFWVGLLVVVVLSNGIGIGLVLWFWSYGKRWTWGFAEMLAGMGMLFVLGAGFYVGPAALFAAGFLRVAVLCVRSEYGRMYYV